MIQTNFDVKITGDSGINLMNLALKKGYNWSRDHGNRVKSVKNGKIFNGFGRYCIGFDTRKKEMFLYSFNYNEVSYAKACIIIAGEK